MKNPEKNEKDSLEKAEETVGQEKMDKILCFYFKIMTWNMKRKIRKKLKSKQYVNNLIDTLVILILQNDRRSLKVDPLVRGGDGQLGGLSQVLNKHKGIKFSLKDYNKFQREHELDEAKARMMMEELYNELERLRKEH
jgi:hypothetical protein